MTELTKGEPLWYYGPTDEYYTNSEATRDAAMQAGTADYGEDGFHICEGAIDPVDVAGHFDINALIESIDDSGDYLTGEGRETTFDDVHGPDVAALEDRIRGVILAWQLELQAKGVSIRGDRFSWQANEKWIGPKEVTK